MESIGERAVESVERQRETACGLDLFGVGRPQVSSSLIRARPPSLASPQPKSSALATDEMATTAGCFKRRSAEIA